LSLKTQVKSVLGPVVRAAWPVVETIGGMEARASRDGLRVRWSDTWTGEFDTALETLPPLQDCPHDLYRELLKPTRALKKHALVLEGGRPSALISLRHCARHWEPVVYQCMPFAIAPALDTPALARALHVLGMEVRIPAGLCHEVAALHPSDCWSYAWHQIEVQGDYEAHWRSKKRQYTIRRARKETAHMQRRIGGAGDLEWIVEQWREQWKDDPGQEVVAADDRLNFWSALAQRNETTALRVHTLMLVDGERRVSGLIVTSKGDTAMIQCGGRDPAFEDAYSAAAVQIFAAEWARTAGFRVLDIAGGPYKRLWGPEGGLRYGAVFRPRVMSALSWACTY
jgi:hypothetical protein